MRVSNPWKLVVSLLLCAALIGACKSDEEKLSAFLAAGKAAVDAEAYDEAIIEFRNVVQIDPNNPEAHYQLAKAYLATKKLKEAYWELHESVRLDPANTEARVSFAQFSLAARDFDEALAQSDALIEADPEAAVSYGLRGDALGALGRFDEAEAAYVKAAELSEDGRYALPLAQFLVQRGRPEDARPWLDFLIERDPSFRSYSALGRHLARAGDDAAEDAFRKALEVAEPEDLAKAYRSLAGFQFGKERTDDAISLLEEGIAKAEDKLDLIYTLASIYRSNGDDDKADALVVEATRANPDDARPHLILSAYRGRQGDLEGALESAVAAIEAEPDNVQAKLRKAELLVDLGYRGSDQARVAEGRRVVEEVLAESPTNPEALFVKAKIEMAELDPQAAADSLRAAVDVRPDWAQARFVLGSALMLLGDQHGARAELARAVELDPGQLDARRSLARIHAALGEHEYAIEQARVYLRERPEDARTRILVAQSLVNLGKASEASEELSKISEEDRDADAWYAIGRLKMAGKDLEGAREALLVADGLRPNHSEILRNLHLLDRRSGRLAESAARIAKAAEEEPENSKIAQLQGLVAHASGDDAAAEAAFKRATELDPEDATAFQQLAAFYRATNRLDDSIATYQRFLTQQPNSARLHERLAILFELKGDTGAAVEHYESAVSLDASLGESKNNLAYLLADTGGDLDRALDLAQEAKALLPDSPQAADTLGWVLYKRGIPSAAIGYLREAAAGVGLQEGAAGVIYHHLALAYEENSQPEKAIEAAQKAVSAIERSSQAARSQGREVAEPAWTTEVRSMLARLKASS